MSVAVAAGRRRFTRVEYHRMAEVGILKPHDRAELIKGDILEMSPFGRRRSAFVGNLTQLLVMRLAGRATVWVRSSLALAEDTEPQPDLTVLRRGAVSYKERDASADDALVVIEVADGTRPYDRSTRSGLYAEAGIPEYWVVDCTAETVEVHRGPGADGYREVRLVTGAATLAPQVFPDVALSTAEIFA
jgi:Uma2 family endonuclease